jgi:hypothetical protein
MDGGRARRQQRAVRTRIGAAIAAAIGFGAAVAGFAVRDHAGTTTVTSTGAGTTATTAPTFDQAPSFDQQPGGLGASPGVGGTAPDSTSRGS